MLKTFAAGAAALVITSAAFALAQTGGEPGATLPSEHGHGHFTPEDRAAFLTARVAALHAGLQLTPEQETAWPAFEKAYRGLAEDRAHWRRQEMGEIYDPVQRAQHRADRLAARSLAARQYADALAPLYQTLDEGQKRRFLLLVHLGQHPRFHHFSFGGFHHFPGHDGADPHANPTPDGEAQH